MNSDLDAKIARDILGWEYLKVPADADGKNECEILTPNGRIPEGVLLPVLGNLHEAYLVKSYSSVYHFAVKLAQDINPDWKLSELPDTAEKVAEKAYNYWKKHNE